MKSEISTTFPQLSKTKRTTFDIKTKNKKNEEMSSLF